MEKLQCILVKGDVIGSGFLLTAHVQVPICGIRFMFMAMAMVMFKVSVRV